MRSHSFCTAAASLAGLALLAPFAATARTTANPPPAPAPATPHTAADHHDDEAPDSAGHPPIIVTGRLISGKHDSIVAPVVLDAAAVARRPAPQIGTILANLPGVSTSGFAPGASRPVLRGFDGPRVQVLTDGIGSLDASSVSSDHGVALDPLNVERIEVLHGPEVLLYAADPAGGAVNALDRRIPRRVPDHVELAALGSYGSAADSVDLAGSVDVALAPRLAAHVDASFNDAADLRIGGAVLSRGLRARTLAQAGALADAGDADGAADLAAQADAGGRLANSFARGHAFGAGLAFIDAGGSLGVSVQRLSSDYGIPPRPVAGERETVSLALRQTRYDLRGEVELGSGLFDRIAFRAGYGDYTHAEIADGAAGTRFFSKAIDSRVELVQARRNGWRGQSGVQFTARELSVVGEERLVPDSQTDRLALFTRQQLTLGAVDLEASGRFETTRIHLPASGETRRFDQFAGGIGAAWRPVEALTLSLSATHGERAPTAEELYIDGLHEATQSYERGNPGFGIERSDTIEAGLRYHDARVAGSVTAYATDFRGYIAPVPTGAVIEDFPVYQFIQVPAKFRGIEAEGRVKAFAWAGGASLSVEGSVDYVHASLGGIGPVPRIPPLRLRGGLAFEGNHVDADVEVVHNARQGRVAVNDIPVDAFTLANASVTWRPWGREGALSLILSGDNLFDVSGRLATSETRDFVPIAGRDVRLTVSLRI